MRTQEKLTLQLTMVNDFDTDAMVTKVYADMWLNDVDNAQLKPLFDNTIVRS